MHDAGHKAYLEPPVLSIRHGVDFRGSCSSRSECDLAHAQETRARAEASATNDNCSGRETYTSDSEAEQHACCLIV